jgi:hypothetical protein
MAATSPSSSERRQRSTTSRISARRAASDDLIRAAEIYGSMGARFPEAWAGLLAAERGDTSRLDAALAYFEEQRATPYVERCRALLQASA